MKVKKILFEKETQEAIQRGIDAVYNVAAVAYGAKGGNVLLKHDYGDPSLSRDGVTNVSKVYLPDDVENMAARVVVQASRKSNEAVGDGTTAAVILTKHFYDKARQLVGSGVYDRMTVSAALEAIIEPVNTKLEKMAKQYDAKNLEQVAVVSAGDDAIGALISDSIKAVGLDGGVVVERHAGLGIYNDLLDGFYFNRGFTNAWLINNRTQLRAEHNDVHLLITEKRITGLHEMAQILEQCGKNNIKRLVIIGEVSGEALNVLIGVHIQGQFDITAVEPPVVAGNRSLFLEDLAIFTNGQVFTDGMNSEKFDIEMLGKASKVVVNEFNTSIVGGAGDKASVDERVKILRKDLRGATDPRTVEAIQERLGKLTGKICIIRVGGATPTDADYTKLRVDDAVCAVRSAMRSGVVPGGGVALWQCKDVAGDFAEALDQPFKQLVSNAGANAERYLAELEKAPAWHGFDLKNLTLKPVNLLEVGIVDPLEVIKEVVVNAATTASKLITTAAAIVDDEEHNAADNKPDHY